MAGYLFLESRDPYESNDVAAQFELAALLARGGEPVTVFLVQNGVLAARGDAQAALAGLTSAGVEVLADEFSLRERAIATARLPGGVAASSLDVVVDHLEAGRKVLWH
jgi:sulfur relay (sulfurtransferase) complex TusBCD TusD component (DsrE family)